MIGRNRGNGCGEMLVDYQSIKLIESSGCIGIMLVRNGGGDIDSSRCEHFLLRRRATHLPFYSLSFVSVYCVFSFSAVMQNEQVWRRNMDLLPLSSSPAAAGHHHEPSPKPS